MGLGSGFLSLLSGGLLCKARETTRVKWILVENSWGHTYCFSCFVMYLSSFFLHF